MALLQELDTGTPIRTGEATVTLTIDGRQVSVPPGTSVMAAAAMIDNPIPKLCATDSVEAFGSCRLCLIEIAGFLHDASRSGNDRPHQDAAPGAPAPRRDGTLHFRPSAGLPHLQRQQ